MAAVTTAAIDRELGEVHRRHRDACDQIFHLLIDCAALERRADVLLDRRLTEAR